MKKILLLLVSVLVILPAALFAGPYEDMADELLKSAKIKKTAVIAVMPFSYPADESAGQFISEEFIRSFVNAGANVVERQQIGKFMKEMSLQQTGLLSDENAAEVGKAAGAKYMVIGSVSEFTKFGFSNPGLKVSAKLVEVSSFKVISASSIEVDLSDRVSPYKNKGVRKASAYPAFLELYGGVNFLEAYYSYDDSSNKTREGLTEQEMGYLIGLRYLSESQGFFTSGYEFNYMNVAPEAGSDEATSFYNFNFPFLIRIPLWTYMPALGEYTNIFFGPSIGAGVFESSYTKNLTEKDEAWGFNINAELLAGVKIGLTDNISFNVEGRYKLKALNPSWYFRDIAGESTLYKQNYTGWILEAGVSFAP